jgi:FAD/FMN-containing dehydrogenase
LQGGFGWHSRALGPACESVVGLDIVTAEGVLVHASETENQELYWAARGSGCGFFGVVVRFHLKLYRRPKIIGMAAQIFRLKHLEEVFTWAASVGPSILPEVEFQIVFSRRAGLIFAPGLEVVAPVIAETKAQARVATAFMRESPVRRHASVALPVIRTGLAPLYSLVMTHYPEGARWGVDNMWTHAPMAALLPGLRRMADTLPPAPSHVLWLNWAPPPQRQDMAFSVEDQTYIAAYGNWKKAKDDARHAHWARDRIAEMAELSTGVQLADDNLGQNPGRFVTAENLARLDAIRARHDPANMFHPWMGRPI